MGTRVKCQIRDWDLETEDEMVGITKSLDVANATLVQMERSIKTLSMLYAMLTKICVDELTSICGSIKELGTYYVNHSEHDSDIKKYISLCLSSHANDMLNNMDTLMGPDDIYHPGYQIYKDLYTAVEKFVISA